MEQFIDTDVTIQEFAQEFQLHDSVLELLLKSNIEHPNTMMANLYEVHQHAKRFISLSGLSRSGKTTSSLFFNLDLFIRQLEDVQRINEEQGFIMIVVAATREQCASNFKLVDQFCEIANRDQEEYTFACVDVNGFFPFQTKKLPQIELPPFNQPMILLGTPQTVQRLISLTALDPNGVQALLVDDLNLIEIYGGTQQVKELASWTKDCRKLFVGGNCEAVCEKKCTLIKMEDDLENEDDDEEQEQEEVVVNNFYYLANDPIQEFIAVYMTLKLHLFQGKTLVLVNSLEELYKLQLFLQRSGFKAFQIYNHQNPRSLKYYCVSIFSTGVISLLIATPHLLNDLRDEFKERSKKKKQATLDLGYTLKKLDNLIMLGIDPQSLELSFQSLSTTLSIVPNDEQIVESLMGWIRSNQSKPLPFREQEIEAFRYRVSDVVQNISKHQVKLAQQLDFKKKLIKSKDLTEYFSNHTKEKELLQEEIIKLKQELRKREITIPPGELPSYLIPELIRKQRNLEEKKTGITKVLVHESNKDQGKIRKKRKLLSKNMNDLLPKSDNEEGVEEEKTFGNDNEVRQKYRYVDQDTEDPNLVDPSRLQILSSRKIWKQKHGFKLKKRNKRLEKKGIFQP